MLQNASKCFKAALLLLGKRRIPVTYFYVTGRERFSFKNPGPLPVHTVHTVHTEGEQEESRTNNIMIVERTAVHPRGPADSQLASEPLRL